MKRIKVKCPASVSNLCCGYDILGMSLNEPFDTIELIRSDASGIRITHTDDHNLPTHPEKNIAGVALQALLSELDINEGFDVIIHKNIKPGSGIGSSAASAAGIIVAADQLLDLKLSKTDLIRFAMEGEVLASGSRHADNLAPCIYGGVVLIRDTPTLDIIPISSPELYVTILHPQIEIKTSYAREILPKEIPLAQAVKQWANVGGLIAGFMSEDYELISRSLRDHIIEPVRSKLIPGFNEVKQSGMDAGALGGGISGSGPSVFMLSKDAETAEAVDLRIHDLYTKFDIPFRTYVTTINNRGIEMI